MSLNRNICQQRLARNTTTFNWALAKEEICTRDTMQLFCKTRPTRLQFRDDNPRHRSGFCVFPKFRDDTKAGALTWIGSNSTCRASSIVVSDIEIDAGDRAGTLEFGPKVNGYYSLRVRNARRCYITALRCQLDLPPRGKLIDLQTGRKSFVVVVLEDRKFSGASCPRVRPRSVRGKSSMHWT